MLSHKTIFCTDPYCVISWSSYSLKQSFPWNFFLSLFILIVCLPVNDNHKHVQGWNTTTTTSFTGIDHNNNKTERNHEKLGEKIKEVVVV